MYGRASEGEISLLNGYLEGLVSAVVRGEYSVYETKRKECMVGEIPINKSIIGEKTINTFLIF